MIVYIASLARKLILQTLPGLYKSSNKSQLHYHTYLKMGHEIAKKHKSELSQFYIDREIQSSRILVCKSTL